jgi:damage-control phosphatase, subfamily I
VKVYLECLPCFLSQTIKTMRRMKEDEEAIRKVVDAVCVLLPEQPHQATPAEIGREVYRLISQKTGVADPYLKLKEQCTRRALAVYPDMKKRVAVSEDRLLTAAKMAIAGNIIDFGADTVFELEKDVEEVLKRSFGINHYPAFAQKIRTATRIVYLADNAGETVFDRILIEELPAPVMYAVREAPIINDAVSKDAEEAGITDIAEVMSSGSDAPGTILNKCSSEFLGVLDNADVIISKGQGNYEALSDENRPIFFLLTAKCRVVARDLGVKQGAIILKQAG